LQEARKSLASTKQQLQASNSAQLEMEKKAESLQAEVKQKSVSISRLEDAAKQQNTSLTEPDKQHTELEDVLRTELNEARLACEKIKKQYDSHIKNVTNKNPQDSFLKDELQKAFKSAAVSYPKEPATLLDYLTHALEKLE
jgi:hypothetical protein